MERQESQLWGYARPSGDIGIRNYVAIIAAMDNAGPPPGEWRPRCAARCRSRPASAAG